MKFMNVIRKYFASVNWRVRARNQHFWVTLVPALALLAQAVAAVFGFTLDMSDTTERLLAVVNAAFVVLAILGIVTDPTTAGAADSEQAMTYETPRHD